MIGALCVRCRSKGLMVKKWQWIVHHYYPGRVWRVMRSLLPNGHHSGIVGLLAHVVVRPSQPVGPDIVTLSERGAADSASLFPSLAGRQGNSGAIPKLCALPAGCDSGSNNDSASALGLRPQVDDNAKMLVSRIRPSFSGTQRATGKQAVNSRGPVDLPYRGSGNTAETGTDRIDIVQARDGLKDNTSTLGKKDFYRRCLGAACLTCSTGLVMSLIYPLRTSQTRHLF